MDLFRLLSTTVPKSNWLGLGNVTIIRGDQIHPIVSGNKLYKLLPFLKKASQLNHSPLISVGGRFSNHLHALAYAGHSLDIPTVGLVQGYSAQAETATLRDCRRWGMAIHFVDKKTFQQRYDMQFWQPWIEQFPTGLMIYEGGWSEPDLISSSLWWQSIPNDVDMVVVAVGSGTTLAGLLLSKPADVDVIGVPVFRDPNNYQNLKEKLLTAGVAKTDIHLWEGYAGKGFGKTSREVISFQQQFESQNNIQLDPVYTSKAFFGLQQKLLADSHLQKKKIGIIHSGGLQGCRAQ